MIEAPQVVTLASFARAYVPLVIPAREVREHMGPTLGELHAELARQGITVTGPWFTHHLRRPTDTFDFEISVPVARPVAPAGRVRAGEWPAMRAARTVHHGGYEQLAAAWGEFVAWIEAQDVRVAADLWERYLVGPEAGPDAAVYRTELVRPLAG